MPTSIPVLELRAEAGTGAVNDVDMGSRLARRPLNFGKGPVVLLFYDGFELMARPDLAGKAYAAARGAARYAYRSAKGAQVYTGYYVAFRQLVKSLRECGCDVRINAFGLARRYATYPIGLAGYPTVLSNVRLPNPAVLGHGDFGSPEQVAGLLADGRARRLMQPCTWLAALFPQSCMENTVIWPVGIDTKVLVDLADRPKDVDVLVYDKIRWDRETVVPRVLDRVVGYLAARSRTVHVLRYGHHHYRDYMKYLGRSRSLLFLCEHETQGLAYQEALSSNIPVLAWDEGNLVDPTQRRYAPRDLVVSSVPYFDPRCGERFKIEQFEGAFETFWSRRSSYRPRDYVLDKLSMRQSGEAYLSAYFGLMSAPVQAGRRALEAGYGQKRVARDR